jgi:PPOX class probable F420-dependent enzyme
MERKIPMTTPIPETFLDLLAPAKKAFANLALVLSDGTPQVTPVWFAWDGEQLIVNTARGRVKDKVLQRRPVAALLIIDPDNPYRYLQIKGHVTSETEDGAYEQIYDMSAKYRGKKDYPRRPGEVRVIYTIRPERVEARG